MDDNKLDKSLFSEFENVETQTWIDKLKLDIKAEDPMAKLRWHTPDDMQIEAFYRAEDLKSIPYINNRPEEAPFLRSTKSNNDWQINRIIDTAVIEEANKIALRAISRGASSVEFNCSQVKKAYDMARLLQGINLEKVALRFDKPMSFKIILKHLITYVEENKINKSKVNFAFNWDAMAYRLISGKYYQTFDNNIVELKSLIDEADANFQNFKVLSINAQHFHNGGATSVQELAFTISSAVEYTVRLLEKGVSMESILKHTHFRIAIGSGYFMEIAKLRALRLMWARAIAAFDPAMESKAKAYIHAMSSLWNKTIFDPYVNLLRTTTETMSAAIGGADVISVLPFDKVYKYEKEFSSRIAQNQQIIIKEEAHFDKVVDPAGGSYYVESLTASLIKHSWELFNKVEDLGGFAAAVESDFVKNEIAISAKNFHEDAAKRKVNILGTNQFPNQLEFMADEMEILPKTKAPGLALGRLSEQFDSIRLQTEKYYSETKHRPKVLLLSFGNLAMRKARAGFISNFFAIAGYEIIEIENVKSPEYAAQLVESHKADINVFCSADDEYFDFISQLNAILNLKNTDSNFIIAGAPQDDKDELMKIGITDYVHARTNVLDTLDFYNKKLIFKD